MKIYIHFEITDKPFGGGNSFLKAFKYYCEHNGIELAKSINDEYDILLCNAANKTPTKLISIDELLNIKCYGYSNKYMAKLRKKLSNKLVIYRSDGFRDNYAAMQNNIGDLVQKQLLHLADYVIFQNQFSLNTAKRDHISYSSSKYSIIFNGINQDMFKMKHEFWDEKKKLKVFSSSWSDNVNKGQADIATISEDTNLEVTYCGRWPKNVDIKNVNIIEPKTQTELALEYQKHDVFLHPARFDPSPNVCLEAISCGLPIIYHKTSGIKELAAGCGIEFDDLHPHNSINKIKKYYSELVLYIKNNRDYYSINRCASEYITLFENILRNKEL